MKDRLILFTSIFGIISLIQLPVRIIFPDDPWRIVGLLVSIPIAAIVGNWLHDKREEEER